ncbi:MAG: malto-oligosyltrehalose trehalohydrolase, partial [Candidatus Aenigmarchaeota archaeon]|nr:malto-oligosyltrehalose trehalohydrolase [Candidatus Aenigmarchaeota archaeon]
MGLAKLLTRVKKNFGTTILPDGQINFNLWAPDAKEIALCIKKPNESFLELKMETEKDGWFSIKTDKAKIGSEYMFKIDNGLMIPDPASRQQAKDVHNASIVVDSNEFNWENDINWKGRPWHEAVLYEIHTGTFTKEGTFNSIKEKLDYFVSLGITAIELMPVADFPGKRNWGYDGVLLFAPDNTYGTPEELKDLIKTAHEKGLMVFLDVVYNHFGPEGNYLYVSAKSKFFESKHITPWGDAINFENRYVRDFFIQNVLFWLEEYHFDGLRLDAVHAIKDDSPVHILEEIVAKAREQIKDRNIHLVLENDDNISKFLKKENNNHDYYEAQWNDDFHHCVHSLITGEKTGYYQDYSEEITSKNPAYFLAKCLAEGFAYQGEPSAYRSNVPRGENSKNLTVSS